MKCFYMNLFMATITCIDYNSQCGTDCLSSTFIHVTNRHILVRITEQKDLLTTEPAELELQY